MPARNNVRHHTHKEWVPKQEYLHELENRSLNSSSNKWEGEKYNGGGKALYQEKSSKEGDWTENPIWDESDSHFFRQSTPLDLLISEEEERKDRISRGLNLQYKESFLPVQKEFMSRLGGLSSNLPSPSEVLEKAYVATTAASEKLDEIEGVIKEKFDELSEGPIGWTKYTFEAIDHLKDNLINSTTHLTENILETSSHLKENILESSVHLKDNILESSSHLKDNILESSAHLVDVAKESSIHLKDNILESSSHLVDVAKESIGLAPKESIDISSMKAEEIERARRLGEKVNPMVEARKRRVEDELLRVRPAM